MTIASRRLFAPLLLVAVSASIVRAQGDLPASTYIAISPNANVLRGIHDQYRGDKLLQRQNEPVAAVSTRNPNHIFVAANDYRTVDISNDAGLGDSITRVARLVTHSIGEVIAKLTGRKEFQDGDEAIERVEASSGEAWIGMYLSNDGGRSYTSYLMPGYPQDPTTSGRSVAIFGRQAASDPVLVAAPAGRFYLGAMAFDRDQVTKEPTFSQIVVSRFTDRNNSETGLNFHFDGMTLVDNGVTSGRKFLDKPAIAADLNRGSSDPNACGPVYIAFTVFDTKEKDPMERSKILFASSNDCGAHFSEPRKINHRSQLNQGVALAIRPSDGAIFAAYRSFSENRIYLVYSTDGGRSFTPGQAISGSRAILAFDQPTLGASDGYAFRTNAMPTVAIDASGKIFVAWQERLVADGNPRIVITTSTDGRTWAARQAVEPTRCVLNANGAQTCGAGPQVMPSLSFTRGRMMLVFYEARPGLDDVKYVISQKASYITGIETELNVRVAQLDATGRGSSSPVIKYDTDADGNVLPVISTTGGKVYRAANRPNLPMYAGGSSPFIGDYIALAPVSPFVPVTPAPSATAKDKDKDKDRDRDKDGDRDRDRDWDRDRSPQSSPAWRWATDPTDSPTASFVAAWGDNRDVIFPRDANGVPQINGDWSQYGPPGAGPCINPGSRNANIYASLLSPRLVAGTPTSFKQLGIQRAFVLFAQNQDSQAKWYRMTIVDSPPTVSASFDQFGPAQRVLYVNVFAFSTVTQSVFAMGANQTIATQPFRVDIAESTEPKFATDGSLQSGTGTIVTGGDVATVVFNADQSNPSLVVADPTSELHSPRIFNPDDPTKTTPRITNPQVANPQVANPQVANPQVANPQVANPQVANPQVANPQVANFPLTNSTLVDPTSQVYTNVTNYTWQIANAGNTVSAFTPVLNIAKQQALAGKKITLYIFKTYKVPTYLQTAAGCQAVEAPRDELISAIKDPQVANPQVANPQVANPQVANPQVANPQVANATFFVAPTDSTLSAASTAASIRQLNPGATLAALQTGGSTDDGTLSVPDSATMLMLSIQDGDTPQPGSPSTQIDPESGLPQAVNTPLTKEDFTQNGAATVAVTAESTDVIHGTPQAIPEAATTGADLAIATPPTFSVAIGAAVPSGTVVNIGPTIVQNIGQQAISANQPFVYGFYLSPTAQIDAATSVLLGSGTFASGLAGGATATLQGGSFAVPANTQPGNYFIGIRVNSGDPNGTPAQPHVFEPEGNDSYTESIVVVTNLAVAQGVLSPATIFAGQSTIASVTIANTSTTPAPASTTAFALRTATNVLLASASIATPAIPAGASVVVSAPLLVPTGTANGNYTVTAQADAPNLVLESNEADNTFTATLRVVSNSSTLTFLTSPGASIAGHPIAGPPSVRVIDPQGAAVPGVLVQMQLAIISGAGALSGTTSALSNASGIATFTNLIVTQAGTYRLLASAPTVGVTTQVASNQFNVTPNGVPTGGPSAYSIGHGVALTVAAPGPLANASDPDGDALTATLASGVSNGTLTLNADGSFTYTSAKVFEGIDGFTFRASDGIDVSAPIGVTIHVTDNPPTATSDSYTVTANTTLQVPAPGVLANDSDPDVGDTLRASLNIGPAHGSVTFNADGSFTYQPAQNFTGVDTFTYRITDGMEVSGTATVTISVVGSTADLSITQTHAPTTGIVGQLLTYTLTVANAGPATATGVIVTDVLPAGLTFNAVTPLSGSCGFAVDTVTTVTCNVGSIAAGFNTTVIVTATPSAAQPLTTVASVSSTSSDPSPANNTASDTTMVLAYAPCASPTFSGPNPFSLNSPGTPASGVVATGDFNHDGFIDAAVTEPNANQVAILLGNGQGGFGPPTHVQLAASPSSVLAGDFDHDGILDLAVTAGSNLVLLVGDGNGGFHVTTTVALPISPFISTAADLDADGNLDVVVSAGAAATDVDVLYGDGAGGFTSPVSIPSGPRPLSVLVADFDGDGVLDIAVPNAGSNAFALIRGLGGRSFATPSLISMPGVVQRLRFLGDVNGDGRPDLGVELGPGTNTQNLMVLLNQGGGSFAAPVEVLPPSVLATFAAAADVNGDGHPDLIALSGATHSVLVALGDGLGGFGAPVPFLLGPSQNHFALVDLTGDGKVDIVATIPGAIVSLVNTCGSPSTSDLSATAGGPDAVVDGTSFTYTIDVTNHGPDFAGGVLITDVLPTGVSFLTSSGPGFCTAFNGAISCALEGLGAGLTASFAINVQANAVGLQTNRVTVTSVNADPNTSDNTVEWTTSVGTNTAPSFTKGPDITVPANSAAHTYPNWATNISPGGPGEANQLLDFELSSDFAALFAVAPAIDPNGNLTFTSAVDASGNATVTVRLHDNGGTVGGGVDTSAPQTFTIIVQPPAPPAIITGNDSGTVVAGETAKGYVTLNDHHEGFSGPSVLASVKFSPGGAGTVFGPASIAVLPAAGAEPTMVYVSGSSRIGIFDPASGQMTGIVPVDLPATATLARANATSRFAYFATGNQLFAIDGRSTSATRNQAVLSLTVGSQIRTMAIDETHGRVYVLSTSFGSTTNLSSSQLSVIDGDPASGTFHQILGEVVLTTPSVTVNDVAVNTVTNRIYVADNNTVRVVDGVTLAVTTIIPTTQGSVASIAVNESTNLVYASIALAINGTSQVVAIDGVTNTQIAAIAIPFSGVPLFNPGEGRLAIHQATGRVYYRLSNAPQNSTVAVIDGNRASTTFNTLLTQIPAGWETNIGFMAIDDGGSRVVFGTPGGRSVTVVDAATSAVLGTVPVAQVPGRLAVDRSTHRAFVLGLVDVAVVDLNTATTQAFAIGSDVGQMALDPAVHLAYVGRTTTTSDVAIVDAAGLEGAVTPPNGGGGRLTFSGINTVTHRIYVANLNSNAANTGDAVPGSVIVIDGATRSPIATVPVGNRPSAVAVDEILNKVYVGNTSVSNDVSANYQTWAGMTIIDGATNATTAANLNGIAARALNVARQIAVNTATGKVYFQYTDTASGGPTNALGVYDPLTDTALALPASIGPVSVIRVNPVLNRIYVGSTDGRLHVLDGSTNAEIATLTVGNPNPSIGLQSYVAVNRTTGKVFVADHNSGVLSRIDGQTNTIDATVFVGDGLTSVALNEPLNRVYVSVSNEGNVAIVSGTTMRVVGAVGLPMAPLNIAADASTSSAQIYVVGACAAGVCGNTDAGVMVVSDPVDPNGPLTVIAVSGAAHGTAGINPDGSLFYAPDIAFAGVETLTYTVTDANGVIATGTVTLTVVAPVGIATTSLPAATVGQSYSTALVPTGGTPPFGWFLDGGQLPPGLALNASTGTIVGKAIASGTYTFSVHVSAGDGNGRSQTLTIVVGPPVVVTTSVPSAFVNTLYSSQLTVGGATGAVTWAINTNGDPQLSWLSVTPGGQLTGTPTTYPITASFTATATDSVNQTASRVLTMNVTGPLALQSSTIREGVVMEAPAALPIIGGNGARTVTFTGGQLPPGVTLTSNGSFTGVPTRHGTFQFNVHITDSGTPQQAIDRGVTWRVSARDQLNGSGGQPTITFGGPGGVRLAQTFTVGAEGQLSAYGFNSTTSCSNGPGPVTVDIQRLTPAGVPDGVTIASGSNASLTVVSGNLAAIALSPLVDVTIGAKFAAILNAAVPCTMVQNPAGVDSYQGGDAFIDTGGGWTSMLAANNHYDIPFRTLLQPAMGVAYLNRSRGNFAGALLGNGKVLLTGNDNSAELYDPSTNTAALTGTMSSARSNHSATALPDGTILIVGGRDQSNSGVRLATAETYDPVAGVFTATSPMPSPRENHRATLLGNGKVLITGGIDPSGNDLATGLLYDPASRSFTTIASTMTTGRQQHTATLLLSGKVLITGGYTSGGSSQRSAELYDPDAGTFTPTTGNMVVSNRGIATATLLNNGLVLIAGGQAGDIRAEAELYNPATDGFTATGSMGTKRYIHTATLLADGSVLMAGGYNEQIVSSYTLPLASLERYMPISGTFGPAGSMETGRDGHLAVRLQNDKVFFAGGVSQSWMAGNSGELYDASTTPSLTTTSLPNGQVGQPYGPVTLAATGGSGGPYQIAVVQSTLAPGLTYDATTFTLAGQPTATGIFQLEVQVTDSGSHTNVQSLPIAIGAINVITSPYRLTDAAFNQPYALQLTASGGAPISWTVLPGNFNVANSPLPPGLTLSSSGFISGTPTNQAYYNFEVRAVDATGQIAQKALSINVVNPLVITTTSLSPSVLFEGYGGGCLRSNGGVGALTWTVASGSLPPGMSLQTNGCFNGPANALGTYNFTVRLMDSASPPEVVSQPLSMSIPYGVDQSAGADLNQPAYTFGGPTNVQIAQHVTTGVTGTLSAIRLILNNCPIGMTLTAQIQGINAAGAPDGNTVASGTVVTSNTGSFFTQFIPLSAGVAVGADQPFTVVYSADQACSVRPPLNDWNGGGDAYVSTGGGSWQMLHSTADGRYDLPFQTIVTPASGIAFMSAYRGGHTVTLLSDGRVLIAGGHNLQTADIYDPSTGTVTPTGNMHFPRRDHRATLLDDGTVLITGGWNQPADTRNYLGSAELYHPDTGTFELLPTTMSSNRYFHSSTKLADGRVLIVGGAFGDCCNTDLPTAEIYTPASRTFTTIAPMSIARREHTATRIPDGRVVLAGGWGGNNAWNTVVVFDPASTSFTVSPHMMATRSEHAAGLLPDGRILLAGGSTDNGSATNTSVIYDPIADTFTDGGTMSTTRVFAAAATLPDGSILVTGGQWNNDCCYPHSAQASMDRYVPGTGWTNAGSMLVQRDWHQATTLQNGKVLLSGTFGWSTMGGFSVETYDPSTAVSLVSTAAPSGSNGVPYAGFTLAGQGAGGGPYTIVQASGGLPPGLSYDSSTHAISGTPTASGVFVPTFTVAKGSLSNTQAVPISIDGLTITSPLQLATAFQGVPYTATLAATGVGTITWSIISNSLPAGLLLNGNTISGMPLNSCCYTSFTVRAVDSIGQTATKVIAINLQPALTITSTSMPDGIVTEGYFACIQTFGGTGFRTFVGLSGTTPTGTALRSDGCFTGTIRGVGSFQLTVQATDQSTPPQTVTKTITINVSLADEQGSSWDPNQPGLSFGSNGRKVAQRVVAGVTGALRGVRLYGISICPAATQVSVSVQGVAPNGGPDGVLVASGTASYPFDYVPIQNGPLYAADQQFTIVADADQLCTIQPAAYDANPGEAYVFNGSWQHLHDVDGRFDIGFQSIVQPPSNLGYLADFRGAAAAAVLVNAAGFTGSVLMVGGGDATVELYDPTSNATSPVASMSSARERHTATALGDGTVLVTGGYNFSGTGGSVVYLATAELYYPNTNSWELLTSQMSAARASHTATLLQNGDVLIAGGYNANTTLASADVYHVASKTFTAVGAMAGARNQHTATLLGNGRVLVAGGYGPYNYSTQSAELYDPQTNSFTAVSHPMVVAFRGRHTATLLPNNQVLLAGGSGSPAGQTSELYDPLADTFTAGPNMTVPRVDHTATLLPNGHVLLTGGLDDTVYSGLMLAPAVSTEVYANGAFTGAGSMLASRYVHTASLLQSGQVLLAGTYGWSSVGSRSFELFDEASVVGLANPNPPAAFTGATFDPPSGYQLNVIGGNGGPYQIVFLSGSLPPGLSFNSGTPTISGTPTQSGTYSFSFILRDGGASHVRLQTVRISVDPALITTTFVPNATNGTPYNAPLSGTGSGALTWTLFSGSLPPGLSLSGSAIAGTPSGASGNYNFTIRFVDAAGQSAYRAFNIFVP